MDKLNDILETYGMRLSDKLAIEAIVLLAAITLSIGYVSYTGVKGVVETFKNARNPMSELIDLGYSIRNQVARSNQIEEQENRLNRRY